MGGRAGPQGWQGLAGHAWQGWAARLAGQGWQGPMAGKHTLSKVEVPVVPWVLLKI